MITRSELRQAQESPIRIFGMSNAGQPVNISAWTVDVSKHGARIKGVRDWSAPGEEIGVRHGKEKARFKIVWVGADGTPHEGQIGLSCVEAGKYIWGIAAPQVATAAAGSGSLTSAFHFAAQMRAGVGLMSTPSPGANNRRRDARYRAQGGARIQVVGAPAGQWATLHDLSLGGCYVETHEPLPLASNVDVTVHIDDVQITAKGSVTVSHKLVGMGVRFGELTPLNRSRLEQVMARLMEVSTEA